jgi:hypothetical protein
VDESNVNLTGKRILYIGPEFYNYHVSINEGLARLGTTTRFYSEMEYSLLFRLLAKLCKPLAAKLVRQHLDMILRCELSSKYDVVFVIRGGFCDSEFVQKLKSCLPCARFYMYQWDSLRQNNYSDLISLFDKVMTFDRLDAIKLNIPYEPLFYTHEYSELVNSRTEPLKHDLAFVGAYHSDRLEVVKKVAEFCDREGLAFRFHLFIKRLPLMRMLLTGRLKVADLRYLSTKSLSLPEVLDIYRDSRAVLDIELNIQSGLSIRTFEALGADLNLVTTNKHVMSEPFYDPKRILVIDRDKVDLDVAFFTDKTVKKPYNNIDRYSLDKWLCRIFE